MPEMDGYDLMTEARKIARDVHVVFMSGFACDPVRHPLGDGFLAKPFSVESLTAVVHVTLGRQWLIEGAHRDDPQLRHRPRRFGSRRLRVAGAARRAPPVGV